VGQRPCCLLAKSAEFLPNCSFKKLGSNQGSKYRSAELGHFGLTVENKTISTTDNCSRTPASH